MFDELDKYKKNDHFFFSPSNNLEDVCNAPTNKSGIYIVFALKDGRIELVYIGRAGEAKEDGSISVSKNGLGGIKENIVNGTHLGEPRWKSWKSKLIKENIEAIDVYWYVTHNNKYADCPKELATYLLRVHMDMYGSLPSWNSEQLN